MALDCLECVKIAETQLEPKTTTIKTLHMSSLRVIRFYRATERKG